MNKILESYYIRISTFSEQHDIPLNGLLYNKEGDIVSISIIQTNKNKRTISELMKKKNSLKINKINKNTMKSSYVANDFHFNGPKLNKINFIPVGLIRNSGIVTYGLAEMLKQCIFIKKDMKNEDNLNEFIEKSIIDKLVNLSPLPISKDNLNHVAKILSREVEELKMINTPNFNYKKVYFINVNSEKNVDIIKRELIMSYSVNQFKEILGRAPELESILNMINPKNLNMKTWSKVISHFGGKDNFSKMNSNDQLSLVWGYEVFKDKIVEISEILKEKGIPLDFLPFKELAISNYKEPIVFDMNRYLARLKELKLGIHIFAFVSVLSDSEFIKNFKELTASSRSVREFLSNRSFDSIEKGGELMSIVCAEIGLQEKTFKTYQEEYLKAMEKGINSPVAYPTVIGDIDKNYSWECIDMRNPRAWVVGLETNCCQHLHGLAKSCVLFAANNIEISGIFRVMKNGKTIAQSFFWIHRRSGTFVFDNIEVLGGEIHENIYKSYENFIDELELRKDIFGFKRVVFGAGYTDISTNRYEVVPREDMVYLKDIPNGMSVYSDAKGRQLLMREFKKNKEE